MKDEVKGQAAGGRGHPVAAFHPLHSVLHSDHYAVLNSALNAGRASGQPIGRAHERLETGKLDVGVHATAPRRATSLVLDADIGGGG